jgi:hypothetical protein
MKKRSIVYGLVALIGVCLLWRPVFAVEPPAPGTYIGPDNVEKYKDFIPNEGVLAALRNGDKIIVATKPFNMDAPLHIQKVTAKYAPQTKLTPDGGLSMYKGGFPFTEEEIQSEIDLGEKSLMVAWNLTVRWLGDDMSTHYLPDALFEGCNTAEDAKERMCRRYCGNKYGQEVISDQRIDISVATGRVLMDPKPSMEGREHLLKVRHYSVVNPRDVAGQHVLYHEYLDPKKNDELWLYVPSIKRVKRMPTSQRSATRAPTDYTWDDSAGWSGKVAAFNWKIVGEEQTLGLQTITGDDRKHRKGIPFPDPNDFQFALSNCYLLEHTPKDSAYGIGKRTFYVRKNSYQSLYNRLYNKRGELWKVYGQATRNVFSEKLGESSSIVAGFLVWDIPREHYTFLYAPNASSNGYMDPHIYTLKYMYSGMRGQR